MMIGATKKSMKHETKQDETTEQWLEEACSAIVIICAR